jgi:hypothetical protein
MYPLYRAGGHLSIEQPGGSDPLGAPSWSLSDGVFGDVPSPTESDRTSATSSDPTWVVTNEPAIRQVFGADQAGNLQFVLACGCPPEVPEDLHDSLVVLSETIYWANYMFLMCSGPEPRMTAGLEKEFRQELPVGVVTFICASS